MPASKTPFVSLTRFPVVHSERGCSAAEHQIGLGQDFAHRHPVEFRDLRAQASFDGEHIDGAR